MPIRAQRLLPHPTIVLIVVFTVVGALHCSALAAEIPVPTPIPCNCLSPEREAQLHSQLKSDTKLFGKTSEQAAHRLVQLAEFYARKSDLKKSDEYLTQALEFARHPSEALIQQARNRLHQSQWSEAEKSAQLALDSATTKQQRADALSELAWAEAEQKQVQESIEHYTKSISLRATMKHTKDSDEALALDRQQLAAVLQREGSAENRKKAIALLQNAIADLSKSKGPKHPITLFCEEQLAIAYLVNSDPTQAEQIMQKVLAVRTTVLGDDNPELSSTLFVYAGILTAANKPKEAEAVRTRALKLTQKLRKP